jgi:hypothetical protein
MTDWVAFLIFGVSALMGTFGKRLVRIVGLAVPARLLIFFKTFCNWATRHSL